MTRKCRSLLGLFMAMSLLVNTVQLSYAVEVEEAPVEVEIVYNGRDIGKVYDGESVTIPSLSDFIDTTTNSPLDSAESNGEYAIVFKDSTGKELDKVPSEVGNYEMILRLVIDADAGVQNDLYTERFAITTGETSDTDIAYAYIGSELSKKWDGTEVKVELSDFTKNGIRIPSADNYLHVELRDSTGRVIAKAIEEGEYSAVLVEFEGTTRDNMHEYVTVPFVISEPTWGYSGRSIDKMYDREPINLSISDFVFNGQALTEEKARQIYTGIVYKQNGEYLAYDEVPTQIGTYTFELAKDYDSEFARTVVGPIEFEIFNPDSHVHNIVHISRIEPICEEYGYGEHWECTLCHKWFNRSMDGDEIEPDSIKIEPNGHSFNEGIWMYDSTNHWHECSIDGVVEQTTIENHIWNNGEVTQAASHDTTGFMTYTCEICGSTKTSVIEKLEDHVYGQNYKFDESRHWRECTVDHAVDESSLSEHIFREWRDSDTDSNLHSKVCTVCGYTVTEVKGSILSNGITYGNNSDIYVNLNHNAVTMSYNDLVAIKGVIDSNASVDSITFCHEGIEVRYSVGVIVAILSRLRNNENITILFDKGLNILQGELSSFEEITDQQILRLSSLAGVILTQNQLDILRTGTGDQSVISRDDALKVDNYVDKHVIKVMIIASNKILSESLNQDDYQLITGFHGGSATISVSYAPNRTGNSITVSKIENNGSLTVINNPIYSSSTGKVTFSVTGHSYYLITDTEVSISGGNNSGSSSGSSSSSGEGSNSSRSNTYSVRVQPVSHGRVTSSRSYATYDSTVKITVRPYTGYNLELLEVTDDNGNSINLVSVSDTQYTFKMPKSDVEVYAEFIRDSSYFQVVVDQSDPSEIVDYPGSTSILETTQAEIENLPDILQDIHFTDVDVNSWYYEPVLYASQHKLMNGYSDGTFKPDTVLTRGHLVTILWNISNGEVTNSNSSRFLDITSDTWCKDAVNWAADIGIVLGFDDNTFRPSYPVTREQMATILYRYIQKQGKGLNPNSEVQLQFADSDMISDFSYDAMCFMVMHGIIRGFEDGSLQPKGNSTRAQAATILTRYYNLIG